MSTWCLGAAFSKSSEFSVLILIGETVFFSVGVVTDCACEVGFTGSFLVTSGNSAILVDTGGS